jgi:hypothetical protein
LSFFFRVPRDKKVWETLILTKNYSHFFLLLSFFTHNFKIEMKTFFFRVKEQIRKHELMFGMNFISSPSLSSFLSLFFLEKEIIYNWNWSFSFFVFAPLECSNINMHSISLFLGFIEDERSEMRWDLDKTCQFIS